MLNVREEDIDRITEAFHLILNGRIPKPVELPEDYSDNEVKQVVEYINRFIVEYRTFTDILSTLSRGELDFDPPRSKMHILQSFKNLHANLRHLTWKTQQIANGDFTQKVDFMGDFSKAFNSMTQQLQCAFAKIERQNQELLHANERMKRDLDAAAAVQKDLLPKELPDVESVRFAWHYEPCDELGGDILNVFQLDDRHVGMYLLDVSGHGVPAALLSVTLSRVLNTRDPASSILLASSENTHRLSVRSPREVAERLNLQFPMEAQKGKYFTMAYAVLDIETYKLQYVLAGHPAPILVRNGQRPQPLTGNGFPIGIVEEADYEDYTFQLEQGDQLYFFSDGITEARNENDIMLETKGFVKLIEETSTSVLNANMPKFIDGFKYWCGSTPLADDLSLLVLEMSGDE